MRESWLGTATRFTFALVPIGFAMWLAHYSFHFLTGFQSIVPVTQRFAADLGIAALGEPSWQLACCQPIAAWVTHFEILSFDLGLLLSLYAGFRIAEQRSARRMQALGAFTPWAILIVLLFCRERVDRVSTDADARHNDGGYVNDFEFCYQSCETLIQCERQYSL